MSGRPRVLVLTPDFPPARGGIQLLAHRVASEMPGLETRVVTADSPGAAEFDARGQLITRRVRTDRRLRGGRNIPLNGVALIEAARFRPQVTLSVHIVTSPAAAVIARILGTPTVQYFHAKEVGARPRLAKFAATRARAAIAVSAYTGGLIEATGAKTDIRLIPPGVDLPKATEPIDDQRPTLLTIARLEDRYKGHDIIIRALPLILAAAPDTQWTVIGDGPLRSGLESLAAANGVSHAVRFLGAISNEERDLWLRRCRALVMPSRLPEGGFAGEGFGIVYLEAGIYGKPVIAGNVAGALDAVADGESGLLVDPRDHIAVAGAATKLLTDRALTDRLGGAAAQRARGFAWPEIAKRVERLLMEQVEGGPAVNVQ